jgi:hypothetical protein
MRYRTVLALAALLALSACSESVGGTGSAQFDPTCPGRTASMATAFDENTLKGMLPTQAVRAELTRSTTVVRGVDDIPSLSSDEKLRDLYLRTGFTLQVQIYFRAQHSTPIGPGETYAITVLRSSAGACEFLEHERSAPTRYPSVRVLPGVPEVPGSLGQAIGGYGYGEDTMYFTSKGRLVLWAGSGLDKSADPIKALYDRIP